jgi:hypothetical protein
MSLLVWRAFFELLVFDLYVARRKFAAVYTKVCDCPTSPKTSPAGTLERICSSVDIACIWYWKDVLCLQRSAATACLLKRSGIPAELVIGAQQTPFRAHAWVEVEGKVVNDKPYTREMYSILDRCR